MSIFSGIRLDHGSEDEAEKPFWISYADLMSALMVLFLVVMLASLVALTRTVTSLENQESENRKLAAEYIRIKEQEGRDRAAQRRYRSEINVFWDRLETATRSLRVEIDRDRGVINFGSRAQFETGSDKLSAQGQVLLRRFTPRLLDVAETTIGRRVLRRAVVEGYADRRGSYLLNLGLSLDRSQRVLCTLVAPGGEASLSGREKRLVRDLFLVGGFAFNRSQRTLKASRRVEMRLEFFGRTERRNRTRSAATDFGRCSLGG